MCRPCISKKLQPMLHVISSATGQEKCFLAHAGGSPLPPISPCGAFVQSQPAIYRVAPCLKVVIGSRHFQFRCFFVNCVD